MVRVVDREKARTLRAKGKSYSEIREELNIGKSTLSGWLRDMPLTKAQMRKLRDINPRRIENFRTTMRVKREGRLNQAYIQAKNDIGKLTRRDLFIAGLYLYWAEGTKSALGRIAMTNTDPSVLKAFLDWCKLMRIPHAKLRVKLHLYKDMNIEEETRFWSQTLAIPNPQFRKPYIKKSRLSDIIYKSGYGHGTCNIIFDNVPMWEYITMALKYIREQHTRP